MEHQTPAAVQPTPGRGRLVGVDVSQAIRHSAVSQIGETTASACIAPWCENSPVPTCPVPLCVKHISRVYHFADDHIAHASSAVQEKMRQREAQAEAELVGSVYFARFDRRIKIGFSTNVPRRLTEIPTDELLAAAAGTRADELRLHDRFAAARINREWFKPVPELLGYIERVKRTQAL
jgi:hypothetical protein